MSEPDFVPQIWKRNNDDGDDRGNDKEPEEGSDQNKRSKTSTELASGDNPMQSSEAVPMNTAALGVEDNVQVLVVAGTRTPPPRSPQPGILGSAPPTVLPVAMQGGPASMVHELEGMVRLLAEGSLPRAAGGSDDAVLDRPNGGQQLQVQAAPSSPDKSPVASAAELSPPAHPLGVSRLDIDWPTIGGVPTPPTTSPTVSPIREEATPMQVAEESLAPSPALRRSGRQKVAADGSKPSDEDSMTKAMRLRASRNLNFSQGTTTSKSFLSFSNAQVSSNLESLGLNLGRNAKEKSVSSSVLKNVEFDHFKVTPKNKIFVNDHLTDSDLDEEEVDDHYDGQLLTHLVGDVSEVGLDDTRLEPFMDLTATGRRSKSSKKTKKPSKRVRVSTTTNVSR